MSITELPTLNRLSPTFKSELNTFFGSSLPTFSTQLNIEIARINTVGAGSYSSTSTTTLTIGDGDKTLDVEGGKGFVTGQYVSITNSANIANYMRGVVKSYNVSTGELVVTVDTYDGTGTNSAWSVGLVSLTSAWQVGDIRYAPSSPGSDWLECDGGIYLQGSYPDLYDKLGLLADSPSSAGTLVPSTATFGASQGMITWGGSQFISVGATTIYTNIPPTGTLTSITHGLGLTSMQFVASNGLTTGNLTVVARSAAGSTSGGLSTDQGNTWTLITLPVGTPTGMTCGKYSKRFFIWGNNYLVWSDNGTTWNSVTISGEPGWMVNTSGNNWMMQISTGVRTSTDNGVTWSGVADSGLPSGSTISNCATEIGGAVYAGGTAGGSKVAGIFKTDDNGASWSRVWSGLLQTAATSVEGLIYTKGILIVLFPSTVNYIGVSLDYGRSFNFTPCTGVSEIYPDTVKGIIDAPSLVCAAKNTANTASILSYNPYKYLSYDLSTQFATPVAPPITGLKPYIKALQL